MKLTTLAVAPFCLSAALAWPIPQQQTLTVDQIFQNDRMMARPPQNIVWSPDGTQLSYLDEDGNLVSVEGATGTKKILLSSGKIHSFSGSGTSEQDRARRTRYHEASYIWVPDSKHLLFDSAGQLWFIDTSTGTGLNLASTGAGSGDDPQFSPDGEFLSYVKDHNLYTRKMRESNVAIKLTDSPNNKLLNGQVDWVYEEELDVRSNYFWAPDSKHIAYLQTNEAGVPQYPIVDWIPVHATVEHQYYPQPGDQNPVVRVGIVGPNGGKSKWINVPLDSGNDYIPRFGWVNAKTVWIETLTRDHKRLTVYFADIASDEIRPMLTKTDDKFLDESYDLMVSAPEILVTGWRDGHNHIYLYRVNAANPLAQEATLVKQLTSGDWDVSQIKAVDWPAQTIYYLSNESDPRQQEIWAVKLDGSNKHQIGGSGGWHDPTFSPNAKFFADTVSSFTTPPVLALCRDETRCSAVWQAAPLGVDLLQPVNLELKASDGKTTLYGRLVLPPQATAPASVPLIVNPYGGPHAQTVTQEWNARTLLFDQVLAEHGFAVLHVDNRGMGGRGRDFAQAAYRNFGPVQLSDQLAALDQTLAKYPQLDAKRLGWWGWSWGGTFTLYSLTHSDRFLAGVSVAPVTDWSNYDSIYTERYLGQPQDNADVYRDDSVVTYAANLKGHLLLVHGTGDDNVHFANTVQFVQKLIEADIPYDLQIYPRKLHGIEGPEASTHLFRRILAQFESYLMIPPPSNRAGEGKAESAPANN